MMTQRPFFSSSLSVGVPSVDPCALPSMRGWLNSPWATSREGRCGTVGEVDTHDPGNRDEAVDSSRLRANCGGEIGSKSVFSSEEDPAVPCCVSCVCDITTVGKAVRLANWSTASEDNSLRLGVAERPSLMLAKGVAVPLERCPTVSSSTGLLPTSALSEALSKVNDASGFGISRMFD